GCCARATSGHATTPPRSVMKSRRLVGREKSIMKGNGGSVMTVSPSQPEAHSGAPMAYVALRSQRNEGVGIEGRRSGTARPFPLWRLRSGPYDAHQPKIFESGISIMSPGANTWTLNIQPLDQFRAPRPIHIVQHCGLLATYRPVSCLSASTICRCIRAI